MTTTTPTLDTLAERIRERLAESDTDEYCPSCGVQVTSADMENEACTNCGATLVADESADEDLWDIADYENMRRCTRCRRRGPATG